MMRFGTYNVLGLRGYPTESAVREIGEPGSDSNIAHFTDVFGRLECDILGLQEGVHAGIMRSIALGLDQFVSTAPSPLYYPGHILTGYPILESRVYSHSDPGEDVVPFSRTAGSTLIDLPGGEKLWVVNVHLHPGLVDLRARESKILMPILETLEASADFVVVQGDFNCAVEEVFHDDLKDRGYCNAMETVGGGLNPTMDTAGKTLYTIDHIYFSASLGGRLMNAEVVRENGFRQDSEEEGWSHSDHLPVWAEVDL